MYCYYCGTVLLPHESFCRGCSHVSNDTPNPSDGVHPLAVTSTPNREISEAADARRNTDTPAFNAPEPVFIPYYATSPKQNKTRRAVLLGAMALFVALASGLSVWYLAGVGARPAASKIVLRLHGSNTMGAEMIPALVEDFLKKEGVSEVRRIGGKNADEMTIEGVFPNESAAQAVEIKFHGSDTAFDGLATGACDIGLASRKIKTEELQKLSALGDLTARGGEHVIALDGIAIIVNSGNKIKELDKNQIARIFTGEIKNWAELGGAAGDIKVFARDEKSGTFDTFKNLVLGKDKKLTAAAKTFEDSKQLSFEVAKDENGVGFVGLPFIGSAAAIAVFEKGVAPLRPTVFTLKKEQYLLKRRLYLYTPPNSDNELARRFVEFARSDAGQGVVERSGFVGQTIAETVKADGDVAPDAPEAFKKLVAGAESFPVTFRFSRDSAQLDNKAHDDIERVIKYLSRQQNTEILLIGFADDKNSPQVNQELSQKRAQTVADEFKKGGIEPKLVVGLGAAAVAAASETDEDRERNLRVEVWLRN